MWNEQKKHMESLIGLLLEQENEIRFGICCFSYTQFRSVYFFFFFFSIRLYGSFDKLKV